MSNKYVWLAIEGLYNEEDVLGAFASKDTAMKLLNTYSGAKLKWRESPNGNFYAEADGYDYYVRQCLFDDEE